MATAAPPTSIKAVPIAVFNSPWNKILCTIQSSKRDRSGSCWFQHLLKSHPLPYRACICSTSQSAGIGQGLLPNLFCFLLVELCTDRASLWLPFSPLVPNSQHLPAAMNATCMTGTQALGLNEAVFFINIILAPKPTNYSKNKRQCQKDNVEYNKKKK